MKKITKNILKASLLLPLIIPMFCMFYCSNIKNINIVYEGHIAQTKERLTFDTEYDGKIQHNVISNCFYTPETKEQDDKSIKETKLQSFIVNFDKADTMYVSQDWSLYKTINYFQSLDYYDQYRLGCDKFFHMGEIFDQVSTYYSNEEKYFWTLVTHQILITPNYSSELNNFWPYELYVRHICREGESNLFSPYQDCAPFITESYANTISYSMSKTHFNGETCAHSSYPIACGIPTVNIISSLHYCPIKACGDEISYSFFNENNKLNSCEQFQVKNYLTSQVYQTASFLYKREKDNPDQKYKFIEYIDTNTISFCENEKIYNKSSGKITYKQYPNYENVFCFPFKTAKYIMQSE